MYMQTLLPRPTTDLFREHRDDLINLAAAIVGERAMAEDIVQDAFLQFAKQSKLRKIEHPYAYLIGTVRKLGVEVIRRQIVEGRIFDAEDPDNGWREFRSSELDPETALALKDDYDIFQRAVSELPAPSRRAILMHLVEGMTVREISARLGLSVGKTHALIKEAITHCRHRVGDGPA